jgi:citrate synthase
LIESVNMVGRRAGCDDYDMLTPAPRFIDSTEAARLLGVTRQTLYSYVSRGLLRARPAQDDGRGGKGNVYSRADVMRLATRAARGRKPKEAAQGTLDFGLPVLESGLTLIADGALWYCGRNASELAAQATLEETAALLWHADGDMPFANSLPRLERVPLPDNASPLDRAMASFSALAIQLAPLARDASLAEKHARCAALVGIMAAALLDTEVSSEPLHAQCARVWRVDAASAQQIRAALVLCADHELNASSFAARCVASTGAQLHAAVLGGLAALSGPRHGAASEQVEMLLDRLGDETDVDAFVAAILERHTTVAGFGHRLYPQGDPRAVAILAGLSLDPRFVALQAATLEHCGERPNLDFALVAMRRTLGLPRGSASMLFALGRTVGWLAHALEQQAQGQLIRPRANYVGERPSTAEAPALKARIVRMRHR